MEITITEALRLKKELSSTVNSLNYKINTASYGVTTEDGFTVSVDNDKFEDIEVSLIKALRFSDELNSKLAKFNLTSNITNFVRQMKNSKLLLDVYNRAIDKTKPRQNTKFENLGTVMKTIQVKYTPYVTSKEMKKKIGDEKKLIRELQNLIELHNQDKITVSFSYEDLGTII